MSKKLSDYTKEDLAEMIHDTLDDIAHYEITDLDEANLVRLIERIKSVALDAVKKARGE